jgi:beta-galactosidase/beta-glucuronidase
MKKCLLVTLLLVIAQSINAVERERISFNGNWLMQVGDVEDGQIPGIDDHQWQPVTLPRAWNEEEAFSIACAQLSDTIVWYRKHFNIDETEDRKFFVEFEGVRFGADVYLNGHHLGLSENGVMAFGFDLTPYIVQGENVLAVRTDNSWNYHERSTGSTFQWNNKNFNANYGGIPKNVWFHTTGLLYQTLPLYSNLGTTGTYVYATDFDIANHKATVHVESQVKNDDTKERRFFLTVVIKDADGNKVAGFNGDTIITLQPGETGVVKAAKEVQGLHFWSWGYGYLYTVETYLRDKLETATASNDLVITRTGFRKTRFAEGKIWLNDRVIMMHGYAQRTSNE